MCGGRTGGLRIAVVIDGFAPGISLAISFFPRRDIHPVESIARRSSFVKNVYARWTDFPRPFVQAVAHA